VKELLRGIALFIEFPYRNPNLPTQKMFILSDLTSEGDCTVLDCTLESSVSRRVVLGSVQGSGLDGLGADCPSNRCVLHGES